MKHLLALRQAKQEKLDKMNELLSSATSENRSLSKDEQTSIDTFKTENFSNGYDVLVYNFCLAQNNDYDDAVETTYCDGSNTKEAVRLAEAADVTVLVVGLASEAVSPHDEGEGKDRDSLILPDDQAS